MRFDSLRDPRRVQFLKLVIDVHRGLMDRFVASRAVDCSGVAERLGIPVERARLLLSGDVNLTLRELSDLAWALDAEPHVTITAAPPTASATP